MDHAICDDLAAVVVPRESCRPPRAHCHSFNLEDQFPINPTGLARVWRHHVAQAAAAAQGLTEQPSTRKTPRGFRWQTRARWRPLPQRLSYRPPCQANDLGGEDAVIRDEANAGRRTLPLAQIAERTNAPVPMRAGCFGGVKRLTRGNSMGQWVSTPTRRTRSVCCDPAHSRELFQGCPSALRAMRCRRETQRR